MVASISDLRKYTGWGAAYSALLPFTWESVYTIQTLAHDGLKSGLGMDADILAGLGAGILALIVTGILLLISRVCLKSWPRYIVVFVFGLFVFNATQILAMAHSAGQIEKCGYPICGWSDKEISKPTNQ